MDIFEESLKFVETMSVYLESTDVRIDYAKNFGPVNKKFNVEYAKFRVITKDLNEEELAAFEEKVNKAEEIAKKSEKEWKQGNPIKQILMEIPDSFVDTFRAVITLLTTKDIVNEKGAKTSEGIQSLYFCIHIAREAISVRKKELKKEKNKK